MLLVCGWLCAAAVAHARDQRPSSNITDSGYLGRTSHAQDIHWLDQERIVFLGYKPGQYRIEDDQKMPRTELVLWNTATGQITKHADMPAHSWLCVDRLYVSYGHFRGKVRSVRSGEFGKERASEEDVQPMHDETLALSPVSCRDFNPRELRKRYGEDPIPLVHAGEYLDRTSGSGTMRYFPANGQAPIALSSIPASSVITTPRYSAYADRYVFQQLRTDVGPNVPHNVWLLDRRGNVTHIEIYAGPWMAGSVQAMPAAMGLVMTSLAIQVGRGIGAAGLYVVERGLLRRIMPGVPDNMAVSPDGCKIATSINTDWGKQYNQSRIVLVNLCTGKT